MKVYMVESAFKSKETRETCWYVEGLYYTKQKAEDAVKALKRAFKLGDYYITEMEIDENDRS